MTGFVPEKLLLARLRLGDPEAFSLVYDRYAPSIYRYIYFKVSKVEEAQDLTSEVFLRFWQQCNDGQEVRSLKAFIYRIATNAVIDHYRKQQNWRQTSLDDLSDHDAALASPENIAEATITKTDLELVATKVHELKDEYREVLVMRYLDDLSTSDIATVLNKSQGTVRVLLHRALKALRSSLQNQ